MEESFKLLAGKKILITGGLGFIGSNLAITCVKAGADVTIYDSLALNSGGNLFNIEPIKDKIRIIFSDILDFKEVSNTVYDKHIIFNCAASTSHPLSMREPLIDSDVNSKGLLILLEACKRFNRSIKFIHIGTSTQLGSLRYQPADEQHPEFPTDIYSANKSVSEKYAIIYGKSFGLDVSVIRLSNVYGPRACIRSSDFTFNNYFVGLALQNKQITIYGNGTQMRNFIYVDDVINALIMASMSEKSNGEVFFAVSDEHCSVGEIARRIIETFGKGSLLHIDWPSDRKSTEIGDAIISNKKIKEFLKWKPLTDIDAGLRKTKEYFEMYKAKYLP